MNFDKVICPSCKDKTTVQYPNSAEEVVSVVKPDNEFGADFEDWSRQECEECFSELDVAWGKSGGGGFF